MTTRFPDVQRLLVADLEQFPGPGRTGIETPELLETVTPFVRIRKVSGHSDLITDVSTVQIDVFTLLYASSEDMAEQIRQYLVGPPPPPPRLDRVDCVAAPQELPWDDESPVRRFGATYQIQARRYAVG